MKNKLLLVLLWAGLSACAQMRNNDADNKPLFIDERVDMVQQEIALQSLALAPLQQLQHGGILKFTPLEITGFNQREDLQRLVNKIGRSVKLRRSSENILADYAAHNEHLKTIQLQGVFSYADMAKARQDFPLVPDDQLRQHASHNNGRVDVVTWQVNYGLQLSSNNKAFRVIMNTFEILDIRRNGDEGRAVPVLILFLYRHPQYQPQDIRTTAVVFDYLARPENGKYAGPRQVSDWLPLQADADSGPYSVELTLVEVSRDFFDSYRKIGDLLLTIKKYL